MKEKALGEISLTTSSISRLFTTVLQKCAQPTLFSLVGFLLSRATVFGELSPLGISFAAAVPQKDSLFVSFAIILGYLLPGGSTSALRYAAAIVAVMVIRWTLENFGKIVKHPAFAPSLAATVTFFTGIALNMTGGSKIELFVATISEAALAGGATYFFGKTITLLSGFSSIKAFTPSELTSVIITVGALLISVAPLSVAGISPARVAAVFIVLFAARFGHETAGSIAGISAGIIMGLSGNDISYFAGSYGFGGLMAGVFSRLGRLPAAIAFVVASGIVAVQVGGSTLVYTGIYEMMIAASAFVLIPSRWYDSVSILFDKTATVQEIDDLRKSVTSRLSFASKAMSEVSVAVEAVTMKLGEICSPNLSIVSELASDTVCTGCGLKMFCFGPALNDTKLALGELTKKLHQRGSVSREDASANFQRRCCHLTELVTELNTRYHDFSIKAGSERQISEVRTIVSDQFEGMARLLDELSTEFETAEHFDIESARDITDALKSLGLNPIDVTCRIDKFDRMTVSMRVLDLDKRKINRADFVREVSIASDRSFDSPRIAWEGNHATVSLIERAELSLSLGCAQFASGDAKLCGDAYECFLDGKGRAIMIISDGMGTGGRAAVDGAMASGILSRLIKAGFGFDCSLGLVNSSMMVKSGDESLATLDVACLDLYTGQLEMLKAGAPLSLIKKKEEIIACDTVSFPVGILRDVHFEKSETNVQAGDIILMVSDGVLAGGCEWLQNELELDPEPNPQKLAEQIAKKARNRRVSGRDDDITVLVGLVS